MALNIQTLKTRSLTAAIFVVVMLLGLLWNFWSFVVLFTIIHWGCWIEYLNLIEKINDDKIEDSFIKNYFAFCGVLLAFILGIDYYSFSFFYKISSFNIDLKYIFWALLFLGLLIFLFQNKKVKNKTKKYALLGFVYLSIPFTFLFSLTYFEFKSSEGGIDYSRFTFSNIYPLLIIFSIWINDTMAYIVGSLIGKTPFSKISPKKTWEGTGGGAVLCIIVMVGIGYAFFTKNVPDYIIAVIAALCAIFGTLGDLFESKLKRLANVKDSGSFMPGHGGFLDRFDSLLFAVPAVWVYVKLFL
ncbi:MAG: phosphatidate cytidylyltransferase [Ferruginibacter sp.]|nr:phosphatidate cytidylyltransferase [Ferruginibacter sp.]